MLRRPRRARPRAPALPRAAGRPPAPWEWQGTVPRARPWAPCSAEAVRQAGQRAPSPLRAPAKAPGVPRSAPARHPRPRAAPPAPARSRRGEARTKSTARRARAVATPDPTLRQTISSPERAPGNADGRTVLNGGKNAPRRARMRAGNSTGKDQGKPRHCRRDLTSARARQPLDMVPLRRRALAAQPAGRSDDATRQWPCGSLGQEKPRFRKRGVLGAGLSRRAPQPWTQNL